MARSSACSNRFLKKRAIAPMPCKHGRTFEIAREARRTNFEAIGADDPYGEELLRQPEGYCDCGPFNRRNELWEIAEICVKRNLTREQMSDIAAIMLVSTASYFTYNHFHHTRLLDLFCGEHKDFLRALNRQRKKGVSFDVAITGLVARWQWRMMPNA